MPAAATRAAGADLPPDLAELRDRIGCELPRALERYERRGYVAGWRWGWISGAVCGACTTGLAVLLVQQALQAIARG